MNARAVIQIISQALEEDANLPLTVLGHKLDHINDTKAEWRETAAFLAAALWSERQVADTKRAKDARFAISQIAAQVRWFEERTAKDGVQE